LLLESFHGDSSALVGGVRTVQVVSLLVLVGALILLRQWAIAQYHAGADSQSG
jgi:hypothetical protein